MEPRSVPDEQHQRWNQQADARNARQRLWMRQSPQFPHRFDRVQGITYPYEYIRADPEMVANIGRYSFGGDNAQG
jgi:hypothetical protein